MLSIGEVLTVLTDEFPDITISKIRFLESQGLVQPERNASGYRQFAATDIERLRWILRQQRDHFLPLKVIRRALERGVDVIDAGAGDQPTLWSAVAEAAAQEEVGNERERLAKSEVAEARRNAARSRSHPSKRGTSQSRRSAPDASENSEDGSRRRYSSPADVVAALQEAPLPASSPDPTSGPDSANDPGSRSPSDDGDSPHEAPSEAQDPSEGAPVDDTASENHQSEPAVPEPQTSGPVVDPPDSENVDPPEKPSRGVVVPGGQMRQLNREELLAESELTDTLLEELIEFGLLQPEVVAGEQTYSETELSIAVAANRCAELGFSPRLLRMYKVAASREAGLLEQVAMPLLKQRNPAAKTKATETVAEVSTLGAEIHALLLGRELGPRLAP